MVPRSFCLAVIVTVFAPVAAAAQTSQNSAQHSLGGYLGFTDRSDIDLTVGGEYEYRYDPAFGFGAVLEHTPDAFGDRSATLVLATLHIYPIDRLKLIAGIGGEFTSFDDELRFRVGAGYDFLRLPFKLTPRFAVDFGDRDASVSFGATASLSF